MNPVGVFKRDLTRIPQIAAQFSRCELIRDNSRNSSLKTLPCLGYIARDLRLQFIEGSKFSFVAQFADELDFQLLPVNLAGKIQQMNFNAWHGRRLIHSRANADVENCAQILPTDARVCGVNPVWRKQQSRRIEVRSGETDFLTELISAHDFASEGVRAPEHLTGSVEISGANRFANACATYGFAIKCDGGEAMYREIQIAAQFAEQRHVAAAFVAENKICADADAFDVADVARESANELIAGLLTEFPVEMNLQQCIRTERFDCAKLLRLRID